MAGCKKNTSQCQQVMRGNALLDGAEINGTFRVNNFPFENAKLNQALSSKGEPKICCLEGFFPKSYRLLHCVVDVCKCIISYKTLS